MIIEPVLGEGGYVPPPAGFLNRLRQVCDRHGILLILDEVQSGFGRTGKFFALEHEQVRADILVDAGHGTIQSLVSGNKPVLCSPPARTCPWNFPAPPPPWMRPSR